MIDVETVKEIARELEANPQYADGVEPLDREDFTRGVDVMTGRILLAMGENIEPKNSWYGWEGWK